MDNATLDITVISAEDVKNVRKFGRTMRTYAIVWSDPTTHNSTRIDRDGDTNPRWNDKLQLVLNPGLIHRKGSTITIEIYCKTRLRDKLVGWTKVPLSDIVHGEVRNNSPHFLSYRLKTAKGKPHGIINLSVRLLHKKYEYFPQQQFVYSEFHQNGAVNGCGIGGVPSSIAQQPQMAYPPSHFNRQGTYSNVNANYNYLPLPATMVYPPPRQGSSVVGLYI
eukprot:Gb_28892 [translate_table: standard]